MMMQMFEVIASRRASPKGEHDEPVGGEYDKRKNCITKLRAGDEPACACLSSFYLTSLGKIRMVICLNARPSDFEENVVSGA